MAGEGGGITEEEVCKSGEFGLKGLAVQGIGLGVCNSAIMVFSRSGCFAGIFFQRVGVYGLGCRVCVCVSH